MKYKHKTKEEIMAQTADAFSVRILLETNWEVAEEYRRHTVIFYAEDDGGWDGSAMGLSVLDGELYEFSSSHCSCNGFDFDPTPCDLPSLAMRAASYEKYPSFYKEALAEFIGAAVEGDEK